ncbi:MAG: complex I NDUFA9 subunit family protein [Sphingomonadales bacterium]|nr:complex I NDUFA9 subunit family protein [Sphingomonadales bacterium]
MIDRLVTLFGGGGFLGRYVAQDLLHAGARIRIAERHPSSAHFIKPMGQVGQTQFVSADITRPESLPRALVNADVAINFVGILDGAFENVHADGARNAAEAAREAEVETFIQISAIGADPQAASKYARSKAHGEAAVRAIYPDAIVIRPSIVFGPEDQFINRFATMARLIPGALPVMRPETRFQPVYVADLAEAVARAAVDPAPFAGNTYELGGPEKLSMLEINRFVLEAIGRGSKPTLEVPDGIGATMAKFGWLPGAPISWDQWLQLGSDNVVAADARGFEAFGISPRPLAAVAHEWLIRYRTRGRFSETKAA